MFKRVNFQNQLRIKFLHLELRDCAQTKIVLKRGATRLHTRVQVSVVC